MGTSKLFAAAVHIALASCAVLGAIPAAGSPYPERAVKIITQGAAGSGPDVIARVTADHLGKLWGHGVAVVNQSGGAGLIAAQAAAMAEPDGYTLYLPTTTSFVILPELHDRLTVDIDQQFTPIGIVADIPMVIGVSPSLGVRSLPELIERARANPGEIFYSANNRGSLPHLTGERLARQAGIRLSMVAYPGAAAGLQDLMGGRIQMIIESAGALAGAIRSGAVKPIAVASAKRMPQMPDIPTVAETLPGFTAVGWLALMAPARTPETIVRKVSADLLAALQAPEVRQRIEDLGGSLHPMSAQETAEFIKTEESLWRRLVRAVGLKSSQ
jgi:tripartite-type tricarboxylate transporter receptor subunit TctC